MSLSDDTNPRTLKVHAQIRNTPGLPFETVLGSHRLPARAGSSLLRDDYETFFAWRQERRWKEIGRVTGATVASDLEANDEDL